VQHETQGGADGPAGATALGARREPLGRRQILVAAVEFVDEVGLRGLTMRRLGERLGVEAMSLYRYVPGKESLLDGMVELVIDGLTATRMCTCPPRTGGRSTCNASRTASAASLWSIRRCFR